MLLLALMAVVLTSASLAIVAQNWPRPWRWCLLAVAASALLVAIPYIAEDRAVREGALPILSDHLDLHLRVLLTVAHVSIAGLVVWALVSRTEVAGVWVRRVAKLSALSLFVGLGLLTWNLHDEAWHVIEPPFLVDGP